MRNSVLAAVTAAAMACAVGARAETPGVTNSETKTVEAVRRLVEGEEVALMFATFGTAQNVAIAKYLNTKKVPQLFLVSNSIQWDDPKGKPWSLALPWAPPLYAEAGIDVAYARKKNPAARFAVLYQNDDAGRESPPA